MEKKWVIKGLFFVFILTNIFLVIADCYDCGEGIYENYCPTIGSSSSFYMQDIYTATGWECTRSDCNNYYECNRNEFPTHTCHELACTYTEDHSTCTDYWCDDIDIMCVYNTQIHAAPYYGWRITGNIPGEQGSQLCYDDHDNDCDNTCDEYGCCSNISFSDQTSCINNGVDFCRVSVNTEECCLYEDPACDSSGDLTGYEWVLINSQWVCRDSASPTSPICTAVGNTWETIPYLWLDTDPVCCVDSDLDGYNGTVNEGACGPTDCNDTNSSINPIATEICADGVDNDCDGCFDTSDVDCGGNESLFCDDGIDNDCDEDIDINDSDCITTTSCDLTDAYWSETSVVNSTLVDLIVTSDNCNGKEINFTIWEDDGFGGDDWPITQPSNVFFSGSTATGTWTAEYQPDGIGGVNDPPEYYFIATLLENASVNIQSSNMLEVSESDTPVPPNGDEVVICADYDNMAECTNNPSRVGINSITGWVKYDLGHPDCLVRINDTGCAWVGMNCTQNTTIEYHPDSPPTSTACEGTRGEDEDPVKSCTYNQLINGDCSTGDEFFEVSYNATDLDCPTRSSRTMFCPAQIGLPFFNIYNFTTVFVLVALIYFIYLRKSSKG